MPRPNTTPSQTFRSLGAPAHLISRAQSDLELIVRDVLMDRIQAGAEISDQEVELIVQAVRNRCRDPMSELLHETYLLGQESDPLPPTIRGTK